MGQSEIPRLEFRISRLVKLQKYPYKNATNCDPIGHRKGSGITQEPVVHSRDATTPRFFATGCGMSATSSSTTADVMR